MKKFLLFLLLICLLSSPALESAAANAPTITRHPVDWTALTNTMAEFSVTVTGTEPLRYQWQKKQYDDGIWSDIAGANSADYYFIATGNEMRFYRVVVSNDYGSATSDSVRLSVNDVHPIMPQITIDKQPTVNTEVTEGSITGSLSVEANILPGGTITYQWYSNTTSSNTDGILISGATNASLTIPKTLTASGSPYYYYCVLDGADTEITQVAMITVLNNGNGGYEDGNGGGCNGISIGGGVPGILILLSIIWACKLLGENYKIKRT